MTRATPQIASLEAREFARIAELMRRPDAIFVFGSNRAGAHGGGAARTAFEQYGAEWGRGEGLAGRSYAVPTKSTHLVTLPLTEVAMHVERFLCVARMQYHDLFAVTRIGCGLAGFGDHEIAPLFVGASANCELPEGWREIADGLGGEVFL